MTRRWILYYLLVAGFIVVFFALFEPEYFSLAIVAIVVTLLIDYLIFFVEADIGSCKINGIVTVPQRPTGGRYHHGRVVRATGCG
jgi:hypothetical protein